MNSTEVLLILFIPGSQSEELAIPKCPQGLYSKNFINSSDQEVTCRYTMKIFRYASHASVLYLSVQDLEVEKDRVGVYPPSHLQFLVTGGERLLT